jgi:acyl-CoA synthetase (AMP-forming)/AMP-acid ligase II
MRTFTQLLQRGYTRTPERVSVILQHSGEPDVSLTYRQLLEGAHGYARALAGHGVRPGEVVILILQHGAELVYAYWGTILQGAIPSIMPFLTEKLSPERYRADLSALIGVTRPAAIFTYAEFEAEVRESLAALDLPSEGAGKGRLPILLLPSDSEPPSPVDFDSLPGSMRDPDDIALLQHSSGTTGLQKGVALSHRAVLSQLDAYSEAIRLDPSSDVIVSWLPLYHDMGLIACFILPILLGVPLVLMSPFDWVRAPYRLMEAVSKHHGTLSWLPNFAYNFCAQMIRPRHMEGVDLSSWRAVINCSEPVRAASHAIFYEKFQPYGLRPGALQTCYAMAENVFAVTQSPVGAQPVTAVVDSTAFISDRVVRAVSDGGPGMTLMSSGRPLKNTALRVVEERGEELGDGVVGEIAIRSDSMLSGYYNRPDATGKALINGWYLTGDYGFVLDGEVFVAGRKKDLIIVGGKNIYPQDLEALAGEVAGVHAGRVVAFGVFDERIGTEEVVIIAEADSRSAEERERLADEVRRYVTVNSAVALRRVEIVGPKWILKTSSGKVARGANREKFLQWVGPEM